VLCYWGKEMFFSAFTLCTSYSRSHTGHSLEEAPWGPEQFIHLAAFLQFSSACFSAMADCLISTQSGTMAIFWYLKHPSGLGIYRSTLTRRYPTLMCAEAVFMLNVRINVFVLRRSVLLLSDLTVIWKQSITPCERRPSTISSFVRPFKSEHLMTPLQELRVRWGSALTGTSARSVRANSLWL